MVWSYARTGLAACLVGAFACAETTAPLVPGAVEISGAIPSVGIAGNPLPVVPSVRVIATDGRPVPDIAVSFAATLGGGTVSGSMALTDANGIAAPGSWTLGTSVGTNTLTATVVGVGVVLFTVEGQPGPPAKLGFVTTPSATAPSRSVLATQPVLQLQDAHGNAVSQSGVVVTAAITAGGGTLGGTTSLPTASNGSAAFSDLSIAGAVGARVLTFTAPALAPVGATVTTSSGMANAIALESGSNQSAVAGTAVAIAPSVKVSDVDGNGVGGIEVSFAVSSGGGSVTGAVQITNATGIATLGAWTLGSTAGANTLAVTSSGLSGSPVSIVGTGSAGVAAKLAAISAPSADAKNRVMFPTQPVFALRDANENPVAQAGVVVTAEIAAGGGILGGTPTATTGPDGIASFTNLTIAGVVGARTLRFSTPGLAGVSASVTIAAGEASMIAVNAGDGQSASVGTAVATAPSVKVTDPDANPVSGEEVLFSVVTGGGGITNPNPFTGSDGVATIGSWTLGPATGPNALTATAAGLTGSPLTITATGLASAAVQVTLSVAPSATAQNRVAFPTQPIAQLRDATDNPVPLSGVVVTASITAGDGTLSGATATTDDDGVATFTGLAIAGVVGTRTLSFAAPGLTAVTASVTTSAGAASAIAVHGGNGQSAVVGMAVATAPSVKVTDLDANPVSDVAVTFAPATGNGTVTGADQTTNTIGVATVGSWTLGTATGPQVLNVASAGGGLSGSPVAISASAVAGAAVKLTLTAAPSASAQNRVPFGVQPVVQVRDVYDNPTVFSGDVTAAITAGGGVLGGTEAVTINSSGVATFMNLSIAGTVGTRTLTFSALGLTSVIANVTTSAGAASTIAVDGGDGQSAVVGAAVATAPSVKVTDLDGNAVGGIPVLFNVATGGGALTGESPNTGIDGVAAVGSWTLGPIAGSNTLEVTSAGLAGSPQIITATGLAGTTAKLTLTAAPSAVAQNRVAFTAQPVVQLRDAADNPVAQSGIEVTATITDGGGTLGGTTMAATDNDGVATFTDLSIAGLVGTRAVTFSSPDVVSVTANVTTTVGAASTIAVNGGDNQSAFTSVAVAIAPSVKVTDLDANPVSGVAVAFAVASGNGAATGQNAMSDFAGVAAVGSWTLGALPGANTITATAGGLSGSPITFTATATDIKLLPLLTGLSRPLYLTAPAGDSRLFIVEQGGRILVVKNGVLLATPYLDIAAKISCCGEQGLLGMAFHPLFSSNGYFYVKYTDLAGNTLVERYQAGATSDVADAASGTAILGMPQPQSNHNGGMLLFGPDRMLWIGTGDGGGGGDPDGNGQKLTTLLGKMLRIDVDGGAPYSIPPNNPFAGDATRKQEIWGLGLRNPWRYAIDFATGLLYTADVGQANWEEVHVVPTTTAAVNYGWNTMEGQNCYAAVTCNQTGLDIPVLVYDHSQGCSITGGFVYRGSAIPSIAGHYFYSDFCTGFLRSFRFASGGATEQRTWSVGSPGQVMSFGQDSAGELYLMTSSGSLFKIAPK